KEAFPPPCRAAVLRNVPTWAPRSEAFDRPSDFAEGRAQNATTGRMVSSRPPLRERTRLAHPQRYWKCRIPAFHNVAWSARTVPQPLRSPSQRRCWQADFQGWNKCSSRHRHRRVQVAGQLAEVHRIDKTFMTFG